MVKTGAPQKTLQENGGKKFLVNRDMFQRDPIIERINSAIRFNNTQVPYDFFIEKETHKIKNKLGRINIKEIHIRFFGCAIYV